MSTNIFITGLQQLQRRLQQAQNANRQAALERQARDVELKVFASTPTSPVNAPVRPIRGLLKGAGPTAQRGQQQRRVAVPFEFLVTSYADGLGSEMRGTVERNGVSVTINLDRPFSYPPFPDLPEYEGESSLPQVGFNEFSYIASDPHAEVPTGPGQSYGERVYSVTYGYTRVIDRIRYIITTDPAYEPKHALVTFYTKYSTTWIWAVETQSYTYTSALQPPTIEFPDGYYAWNRGESTYTLSFTDEVVAPEMEIKSIRVTNATVEEAATPGYAVTEATNRTREFQETVEGSLPGSAPDGVTQLILQSGGTSESPTFFYYQYPKYISIPPGVGNTPAQSFAFDGYEWVSGISTSVWRKL